MRCNGWDTSQAPPGTGGGGHGTSATHWTMHWTQQGSLMGLPADGKEIHLRGHDFYRLRAGKIADIWRCEDFAGFLGQLGVLPPTG
jgi:hypothetical protein